MSVWRRKVTARLCLPAPAAAAAALTAALNVATAQQAGAQPPPVVVELFTSQGCSSCPPADRFLRELADTRKDVLPLSLHVDYWDRLGWKDEFASSAISRCQREYARKGGRTIVYTPQMILNGQTHVVGSDKRAVNRLIDELSVPRPDHQFSDIALIPQAYLGTPGVGDNADRGCWALISDQPWSRDAQRAFKTHKLDVTVMTYRTEMSETDVRAGENRGRTLSYANVVTGLEELTVESWPALVATELRLKQGEAGVILLQSAGSGAVLSVVTPEADFFTEC